MQSVSGVSSIWLRYDILNKVCILPNLSLVPFFNEWDFNIVIKKKKKKSNALDNNFHIILLQ